MHANILHIPKNSKGRSEEEEESTSTVSRDLNSIQARHQDLPVDTSHESTMNTFIYSLSYVDFLCGYKLGYLYASGRLSTGL